MFIVLMSANLLKVFCSFIIPLQLATGNTMFAITPSQYNPLDEPSPLGLRLRKSPSLLDLIQMKLSQASSSTLGPAPGDNFSSQGKVNPKGSGSSGTTDKLKASNFPASLLRIGCWEVNLGLFTLLAVMYTF